MNETVETVRVVADVPGGFKVINKSDLKPDDKLYVEQEEQREKRQYTKRAQ